MRRTMQTAAGSACLLWATTLAFAGNWVNFANETATRMPTGAGQNDPLLSTTDTQEKDYAWGDVDKDGDIDLVVVRKEIGTSAGKRPNVLLCFGLPAVPGCESEDTDQSGSVNVLDLIDVLLQFGLPCP